MPGAAAGAAHCPGRGREGGALSGSGVRAGLSRPLCRREPAVLRVLPGGLPPRLPEHRHARRQLVLQ